MFSLFRRILTFLCPSVRPSVPFSVRPPSDMTVCYRIACMDVELIIISMIVYNLFEAHVSSLKLFLFCFGLNLAFSRIIPFNTLKLFH